MSRKIKFRAWDIANKRMICPDEFDGLYSYAESAELSFWISNKDTHVMQFINLYDNDGKEIYEGDIVLLHDIYPPGHESHYHKPCKLIADYDDTALRVLIGHREIIGNIYENPELLTTTE